MGKAELRADIDEHLLERAKAAGVSLDDAAELGLKMALAEAEKGSIGIVASHLRQIADPAGAEERARKWAEENAEAIKAHNERIARRGVFGGDLRRW